MATDTAVLGFVAKFSDRASQPMRRLSRNYDKLNRRVGGMALTMSKTAGTFGRATLLMSTPIVAFAALSFKVAADFDASMRIVQAKSGATGEVLEKLREQARKLGATTQFTAQQAADGMTFLAQAGLEANEILSATPKALQLAAANNIGLAAAADLVTNVLKGYNLELSDLNMANDILTNTSNKSNVSISELGESLKVAGQLFTAMGVPLEELTSLIGEMGNAGIKGGLAGTALRKAMSSLLNLTKGAKDVFKRLGIDPKIFKDSEGRVTSFTKVLEVLGKSGATAGDLIKLFGLRSGPLLTSFITKGTEGARKLQKEVTKVGETARIAAIKMEGPMGALLLLRSAFEALQLSLIESGIGAIFEKLIRGLALVLQKISFLPKPLLFTIAILGLMLAAIPPIGLAIAIVAKGFIFFQAQLKKSVIFMRAYNIQAIRTAIANKALANSVPTRILPARDALGRFSKAAGPVGGKKVGILTNFLGNFGKSFTAIAKKVGTFVKGIGGKILAPLAIIIGVFSIWKKNIFGVRDAFASFMNFLKIKVFDPLKFAFTFIKVLLQALFTDSVSAEDAAFLGGHFGTIIKLLNNDFFQAIRKVIVGFRKLIIWFSGLGLNLGKLTEGFLELGGIGAAIGTLFGGPIGAAIGAAIGILIAGIINLVRNWDDVKMAVLKAFDAMLDTAPFRFVIKIGKALAKFFDPDKNVFSAFLVTLFDIGKLLFDIFIGVSKILLGRGFTEIGKFFGKIARFFGQAGAFNLGDLLGASLDFVANIPFIKTIIDKLEPAIEIIKAIFNQIVKDFKFVFSKITDFIRPVINKIKSLFLGFLILINEKLATVAEGFSKVPGLGRLAETAERANLRSRSLRATQALLDVTGSTESRKRLFAAARTAGFEGEKGGKFQIQIDFKGLGFSEKQVEEILTKVLKQKGIENALVDAISTDNTLQGSLDDVAVGQ